MRVVQKYEAVAAVVTPYENCMRIWTHWAALSDCPTSDGYGNLQDSKEFMRAGEAIDMMIDSLPRHQWWAVRKSRGISTVWLFPHLSLPDVLHAVEMVLTEKMKNNIATRKYFN